MSVYIRKFDDIKAFCGIESVEQNDEFKGYNVIFAENGVGKTSLSRAFWLLADENYTHISQYQSIGQTNEPQISLNGSLIINKDNKPNINFDIEIYNADFLRENVPLDTKFEIKKISGENILLESAVGKESKAIQRLKAENEDKIKRKDEISGENGKLREIENNIKSKENEIERIRKKITTNDIAIKLEDITIKAENNFFERYEQTHFSYDEAKRQEIQSSFDSIKEALKNFDELQEIPFSLNIDNDALDEIFNFDIEKEAGAVSEDIKNHIINMGRDFIERGKKLIDSNHLSTCPFCMQEIDNTILEQYTSYFNEKLENFTQNTDKQIEAIEKEINSLNETKNHIVSKFEKFKPFVDVFESKNKELSSALQLLVDSLGKLKALLSKKYGNKNFDDFKQLNLESKIKNINDILAITKDILASKKEQKDRFEKLKQELKELKIKQGKYETFELQKAKYALSNQRKKLADELTNIDNENQASSKEIQQIQAKNRPDIKTINDYLRVLNMSKYTLNANYQIIINANSIQNENRSIVLSGGEKTAISFAYFLARLKLLYNKDKLKNLVIVFDDPISSLDDSRIYMTSSLVAKINKEIANENITDDSQKAQVFVLTHNYTFMTNIIRILGKYAQYSHLVRKNSKIIFECKNETAGYFDSFYLLTFKDIWNFAKNEELQDDYNKALNYGNKIRILLESFMKSNFISEFIKEEYRNQAPLSDKTIKTITDCIATSNVAHQFVGNHFDEECHIKNQDDLANKIDIIAKGLHTDSHGSIVDLYAQHKISLQEVQKFAKIAINTMLALNPNQVLFYIQAVEKE